MGPSAPARQSRMGLGRTQPHTVIKDPNPCQDRSMVQNSQGRLCVHRKPKQGRPSLHTHTPSRVSVALGARLLCSGSRCLLPADPKPLKPTPPCEQEEQVPAGRPASACSLHYIRAPSSLLIPEDFLYFHASSAVPLKGCFQMLVIISRSTGGFQVHHFAPNSNLMVSA